MHIAIIGSRGYPSTYGGFETFVRHFAPYAAAAGHRVTVYNRRSLGLHPAPGDPVEVVQVSGVDSKSVSTLTHGLAAFRHARRQHYDAALVLNVGNGFFLPLLERAGIPTVVNVDGLEWERGKWGPAARGVFRAGARMTARSARRIVVDSEAIGDVWRDQFGRESNFIPYGADVDIRSPERVEALGLEPAGYALVVARFVPENNIDMALDAFEALGGRHTLILVGDANYDAPVVRRVERLQAAHPDTLRWHGHIADQDVLADLWGNAGIYIHGHSAGGTNPALLQAMGYGAPVAALDTEFNREVLDGAGATYRTADDLRAIWLAWSRDAGGAKRVAEECRRRIASAYRWGDVSASYVRVLTEACWSSADAV